MRWSMTPVLVIRSRTLPARDRSVPLCGGDVSAGVAARGSGRGDAVWRELERAGEGEAGVGGGEFESVCACGIAGRSEFAVPVCGQRSCGGDGAADSPLSRGESAGGAGGCPGASQPCRQPRGQPRQASACLPLHKGEYSLPPSTVINGRISRPGEVDRYRLSVTPGQHWNFEIEAATLGRSQLLGLLSVYNAANNDRLASSDKTPADPYLAFAVPQNVKEICVQVEDLLGRGGPDYGYRLQAVREPPGFAIELLDPLVNVPLNGTAAVEFRLARRAATTVRFASLSRTSLMISF